MDQEMPSPLLTPNATGYSTPECPSSVSSTPGTTPSSTPYFSLELAKHDLDEATIQEIHDLFIELAKEAGETMLTAEHEILAAASSKNNSSDLVTMYDKQIEDTVKARLEKAYPHIAFLGEETFKSGTCLSSAPTFVVDPIDGTLNFTNGVPNCAISLGLTINKKPVVGVVYNPFRGDLYTAIKNKGAFLTKMYDPSKALDACRTYRLPLRQTPLGPLNKCLVAVEWGNQRYGPNWALRTSVHNALLTDSAEGGAMCKSIRSQGSAALDFCYVASGMIDAFWEGGVWVWDVCAGWCILEEAGGLVASANPDDWDPTLEGRLYFAVRGAKRNEQEAVVQAVWNLMGDRKFKAPFSRKEELAMRTGRSV